MGLFHKSAKKFTQFQLWLQTQLTLLVQNRSRSKEMTSSAIVRRAAAENQGVVVRVWRWVKATLRTLCLFVSYYHQVLCMLAYASLKLTQVLSVCAVRVLFGQTEWHRICAPMGNRVDEQDRMVRFRTSLALSSALVSTSNAVFDFEAFPVRQSSSFAEC